MQIKEVRTQITANKNFYWKRLGASLNSVVDNFSIVRLAVVN